MFLFSEILRLKKNPKNYEDDCSREYQPSASTCVMTLNREPYTHATNLPLGGMPLAFISGSRCRIRLGIRHLRIPSGSPWARRWLPQEDRGSMSCVLGR